jgi:acetolactate synthase-1/2/3 large subunit
MSKTDELMTGAEAILRQLAVAGVDCLFVSPIAVMAPVWEAVPARGDEVRPTYYRHRLLIRRKVTGRNRCRAAGRSLTDDPHLLVVSRRTPLP